MCKVAHTFAPTNTSYMCNFPHYQSSPALPLYLCNLRHFMSDFLGNIMHWTHINVSVII